MDVGLTTPPHKNLLATETITAILSMVGWWHFTLQGSIIILKWLKENEECTESLVIIWGEGNSKRKFHISKCKLQNINLKT